ncbi:hypothetical protein DBB36_22690 [Flavobacterium sp. WLB]|nr:hypothetical protein AKO67_06430 [Flavobacterium sp. VMW]OWU89159.1 hypothetical protein APR43_18325 [Flavobacterium sp. NLM]PUU67682.1 hypothetical protein DBB36_22690 [Flavobacterium sp. WLB]
MPQIKRIKKIFSRRFGGLSRFNLKFLICENPLICGRKKLCDLVTLWRKKTSVKTKSFYIFEIRIIFALFAK